mgnify:CR=1 FL=1
MVRRIVFLVAMMLMVQTTIAQDEPKAGFRSLGLNIGWYNPSLDYWVDESEFKDADFSGAINFEAMAEFILNYNLSGRFNLGVWQTSLEEDLQGFGLTTWTLTGLPASADLIYHIKKLRFFGIVPYAGVGGEFVFLQQKMRFEDKENPDPVSGSTALLKGIAGLKYALSDHWAMDLEFNYKIGTYNQDFITYEINPDDPEDPVKNEVTEEISLNGPKIGITLRYLFR